jgi:hypothetical protein
VDGLVLLYIFLVENPCAQNTTTTSHKNITCHHVIIIIVLAIHAHKKLVAEAEKSGVVEYQSSASLNPGFHLLILEIKFDVLHYRSP